MISTTLVNDEGFLSWRKSIVIGTDGRTDGRTNGGPDSGRNITANEQHCVCCKNLWQLIGAHVEQEFKQINVWQFKMIWTDLGNYRLENKVHKIILITDVVDIVFPYKKFFNGIVCINYCILAESEIVEFLVWQSVTKLDFWIIYCRLSWHVILALPRSHEFIQPASAVLLLCLFLFHLQPEK